MVEFYIFVHCKAFFDFFLISIEKGNSIFKDFRVLRCLFKKIQTKPKQMQVHEWLLFKQNSIIFTFTVLI